LGRALAALLLLSAFARERRNPVTSLDPIERASPSAAHGASQTWTIDSTATILAPL